MSWTRLSSKVGLGRVSGGFWKDFGRILDTVAKFWIFFGYGKVLDIFWIRFGYFWIFLDTDA